MNPYQREIFAGMLTEQAAATRNAAFREIQKHVSKTRLEVYEAVMKWYWTSDFRGSMTNKEIAKVLGWEINRVTGRVKELREMRLLIPGPEKEVTWPDPDGTIHRRNHQTWIPEVTEVALGILRRAAA